MSCDVLAMHITVLGRETIRTTRTVAGMNAVTESGRSVNPMPPAWRKAHRLDESCVQYQSGANSFEIKNKPTLRARVNAVAGTRRGLT